MDKYRPIELQRFKDFEAVNVEELLAGYKAQAKQEDVGRAKEYGKAWRSEYATNHYAMGYGGLTACYDRLLSRYQELVAVAQSLLIERDAMEVVVDKSFDEGSDPTIFDIYRARDRVADSLREGKHYQGNPLRD